MTVLIDPLAVATATGAGLMAGLFFFCSVVLMPALARISGPAGISAMQAVNVVIIRALFLLVFLGTAAAALVLAVLAPRPLHLVAAAAYLVGVIGVTAVVNVPLNNALDRVAADSAEGERLWRHYLSRWTAWNHVRTITSTVATVTLVLAG
jgi:uncharacterized membrane protein